MKEKRILKDIARDLRRQAEEKVAGVTENLEALSPEAARQVLHELQVHQIELEMQNEELRYTQGELEASRAEYFDLYDLAPAGYFTVSEKGIILQANLTVSNMLGMDRRSLIKQPFTRFIVKESQDIYHLHRRQLFETLSVQNCELKMVRKDGTQFWVMMDSSMKQSSKTGERLCLIVLTDISERQQAEEELKTKMRFMNNVINSIGDPVFVKDDRYRFIVANDALCDMLGIEREKIIGKTLAESLPESQMNHFLDVDKIVLESGQENLCEEPLTGKNGNILTIVTRKTRYVDGNGNRFLVGVIRDITDQKRLEYARQRAAKLESIGTLAGGIAHDFNNILTAILGNISLAKMDTKPDSDQYYSLEQAEKASVRATALTKQLLTFSKGGAPVKTLAGLSELLKDTTSFALRGSTVKCQFSIAADLWDAEIDEGQVSQVINNLVINARQAMPSGGTIEVRAENIVLAKEQSLGKSLPLPEGKYARIVFTDHGIGIPEAQIDKIFDPFFTTKQTGSGLGLSTSFSIIHNHGGHIGVESTLGVGSTFYIYLPASTKTAAAVKPENAATPVGKARILVMDDEETVREVVSRMLKHIGYEDIRLAIDGTEAIKLYSEALKAGKPFDVVILDLTIPGGMGGKETIKKLLEINPKVKAIVSSGYSSELDITEYKGYGFKGAVGKPYTIDQVRQAMGELLG